MNSRQKRYFYGSIMLIISIIILLYSIFFSSSDSFWGIYLGVSLLVISLASLGVSIGPYF